MNIKHIYNFLWPKLSYFKLCLSLSVYDSRKSLQYILCNISQSLLKKSLNDDLEIATFVRNWVNSNSVHLIDDEHDSYAFKINKVVCRISDYHQSKIGKPHLSCGPRSYLAKLILDKLGFETRIIDIYKIDNGIPKSHTLFEYFDKQHKKWLLQDPDFNVYYVDKYTNMPLGTIECIKKESASISYCTSSYKVENVGNLIGAIQSYFSLVVVYRLSYVGKKSKIYAYQDINTMHLSNEFDQTSFKDYLSLQYNDPTIVLGGLTDRSPSPV